MDAHVVLQIKMPPGAHAADGEGPADAEQETLERATGIEPMHVGVEGRCLSAWLNPLCNGAALRSRPLS